MTCERSPKNGSVARQTETSLQRTLQFEMRGVKIPDYVAVTPMNSRHPDCGWQFRRARRIVPVHPFPRHYLTIRRKANPMRIYMFKSQPKPELHAFAGDSAGSKLPGKFAPWLVTGVIGPDKTPPHRFPRDQIEKAIGGEGFQLWRMRLAAK